jgi:TRAP-type transport system periplasmic protein
MKKIIILLLIVILAISFSFGQDKKPVIEMKLAHYAAENHAGQTAAKMFADAVEKRTNGQIKITIYPNNALGSPPEVLEQNILGAVDMSLPSQGQLGKYSKRFNCVMLPFAFKDYAQVDKVVDSKEFINWVTPDLEKAGLVFLSNWEWGFRNLTNSKHPVVVPADVKGLKIRTPPELPTQSAMEALGAIVATINFNELQMALTQGTVDGEENPISVIYSMKLWEANQKYITMTGHNYGSMVHVISKKVWDKLTPDQQKIMKEESVKAGNWMRKNLRDSEAAQIEDMKKLGVQIVYPDKTKFKALMQPAYDKLKDVCGEDNIKAFLKMVDNAK